MNRAKLMAAGIQYDEGVHRFANHPELYEKYLKKFFDDAFCAELCDNLAKRDYPAAFKSAHTLKGTAGNLSLGALYQCSCEMTEALRQGETDCLDDLCDQLMRLYEQQRKAME